MLHGLPPVADANTRLLILGSFPGAHSLSAQQYYAHPRNHFWRIPGGLWNMNLPQQPYPARLEILRKNGVGVWDVYAACERQGSLDSAIRNARPNDFVALARQCPQLRAVAHNGGESWRHARHSRTLGVPVYRLPSSSPANAGWSFARKCAAWREVLEAVGCLHAHPEEGVHTVPHE